VMSAIRDHVADDNARYPRLARWLDGAADSHPLRDALADVFSRMVVFSASLCTTRKQNQIAVRAIPLIESRRPIRSVDRGDQCKCDGSVATLLVASWPE
jgi:hypothetical protein